MHLMPGTAEARDQLAVKYGPLLNEQLEFGTLVTYVANKNQPIFGWFRFKEGFSARLVQELVTNEWLLPQGSIIFDPFAGCGTTLLACQELGYFAIGCDIMPIAVFVTQVKVSYRELDLQKIEWAAQDLLSLECHPTGKSWPKVNIVDVAFDEETRGKALSYRDFILGVPDVHVRDFLMLALLSSLEEASRTSKDGQFLRLVKRPPKRLETVFRHKLQTMLRHLPRVTVVGTSGCTNARAHMALADARSLPEEIRNYSGKVSAIITSPPYLNRYDYSRTYALELCLLCDQNGQPYVSNFEDLKAIRHSLLRSHIESKPAPTDFVHIPALQEILGNLRTKALNNPRIPVMIKGYFEDMNLAIEQMASMLRPGGFVALVVANARFEGELVPVDLILSEIAKTHGLVTTEVRVTRYKGNSSQQMGKYGRVPVRESILFWRKDGVKKKSSPTTAV
jgi:SAM-dependent methyltransferase